MNVALAWRTLLRRLENLDYESKLRLLRRYPKRRLIVVLIIVIFFIFVFSRSSSPVHESPQLKCVNERLKYFKTTIEDFDAGLDDNAVKFVGNGFIGLDSNGQLRSTSSNVSQVLDFETGFYPLVSTEIEVTNGVESATLTDFKNGVWREIKCFVQEGDCACVISSQYAHRVRPNILIQDVQIVNPTKSSVRISLNRKKPSSDWSSSKSGDSATYQRSTSNNTMAVVCTDEPGKMTVSQKKEESLHFVCTVAQEHKTKAQQQILSIEATKMFANVRTLKNLDSAHTEGWRKAHSYFFNLSLSKAPNALNGDRINATLYILLSNTRASTFEQGAKIEQVVNLEQISRRNELCYTGHSTLLYPSRLWQDWDEPNKLIELAKAWMLTLEKRGCNNVIKTGVVGLTQAFVQSLSASSYHDSHLEVGLDAHDLQREMTFGGIPIYSSLGVVGTITVQIRIDDENRPYFLVSSTNQLYACDGGCLDTPLTLGKAPIKIPVKVTKPVTSLLYLATNRRHLEQLKSAIHVAEVGAAPAHEDDVIELHRVGESSGLPTSFWVFLIVVLIAFHLFLAKMFWNEWRKGDMTPYNPYLRNRYSYSRTK